MHIVVLLSWPSPVEDSAALLARHASLSLYEARTRLAADAPRVGAAYADRATADALAAELGAHGFAVAVLDARAIEHDEDRDMIASLAFGPDALDVTLRDGRTRTVRYDALARILQGARLSTASVTEETKSKTFSAGRALLSGGLIMRKETVTSTTRTAETREAFVYLYEAGARPALAMYERRTHYGFLGAQLQASAAANFATVLALLRQHAPDARLDQRLMRPPAIGFMPLPPPGIDPGTWKTDVAAAVLTLGL